MDIETKSLPDDRASDDLLDQIQHRASEREHWTHERRHSRRVTIFSSLAAIAAIIAAVIAYFAFLETKRQAEAGWAQVRIYQEIENRQLRAYLTFQDGAVKCGRADCGMQLNVKNSGQTPAYNVTCYLASQSRAVLPEPLTNETYTTFEFRETGAASIDLGNGDSQGLPACAIGAFVKALSAPPGQETYAWGIVKYRDIFQRCHRSAFLAKLVDIQAAARTETGKFQFLWQSADGESDQGCVGDPPRIRFRN